MFHFIRVLILAAFFCLNISCSSEAERVARFCIEWDEVVNTSDDCQIMRENLEAFSNSWNSVVWGDVSYVCEETTACIPCRAAAKKMLVKCSHEPTLQTLIDTFPRSTTPLNP